MAVVGLFWEFGYKIISIKEVRNQTRLAPIAAVSLLREKAWVCAFAAATDGARPKRCKPGFLQES